MYSKKKEPSVFLIYRLFKDVDRGNQSCFSLRPLRVPSRFAQAAHIKIIMIVSMPVRIIDRGNVNIISRPRNFTHLMINRRKRRTVLAAEKPLHNFKALNKILRSMVNVDWLCEPPNANTVYRKLLLAGYR